MTIIAGFSASRQGSAPLHLAAQIARTTGEKIVAAAVLERTETLVGDSVEREYQAHLGTRAMASLEAVIASMRTDLDISLVVHQSSSIPQGLTELVTEHSASLVVVGSSSSGLLGRIALGSVTERLVHTAAVPVAIAPRGYPLSPIPLQRLTISYGGAADTVKLIETGAELATQWKVDLRIASFTVRPTAMYGSAIEQSAENLVLRQWAQKTLSAVGAQLDEARRTVTLPDVDLVIGAGTGWGAAVDDIAWTSGDMLLLGSGAAGPLTQVFLGSAASKIIRHVPVPVMIVPRRQT
ncbi:universal stress protein [Gordonia sp. CPCC 205515]|uniref:universal stress protein n=1 Tax=Gordonia sp. CPCC 205515 TaxID=3140791 RepID=UPI003AF3DFE4